MDNFKQLIREALTPEFLKESVNEAKAKIGSKIKVHRDEYDKKPLTMTLSRKIPGDYDDAYEATYETIPTGIPKRSEKKTLKVAYGSLGWKNNPIWFLMNPTDLEKKRTPYTESINEGMDEEYILNNLDKWLPNLSPGPFHFYDIIDDGDVDEMVDLIHTYGDEDVLKDYGLDPWDRGDVTQLANYIISRGNPVDAVIGKRTVGIKNEVVGLGDSQPKDDDEDPDDRPAHEAGSFATNEEIELSSLVDKDRMKDAAMEGTMRGLVGKVNKMMEISAKIERTLRREPELDFKVRDTEMLLRHLNHQLSVLKEKFTF